MRETKKLRKALDNWIRNNGACDLEIKEENIQLFNGGPPVDIYLNATTEVMCCRHNGDKVF